MNWDDVATQIRTLVDAVAPVGADEARHHRAASVRGPDSGPAWRKPTLAAAATVLVATAVWAATTSSGDDPGPDVSTDSSMATTGPLALAADPGNEEALAYGTLEITDECTFLRFEDPEAGEDGVDQILLVWPAERTTWVPESATIRFRPADGGPDVQLTHGDAISLGGGFRPIGGPDDGADWVTPPAPACGVDGAWFVGAQVTIEP
jgi:hypothetical protein